MIKLRVDFIRRKELNDFVELVEEKYEIVDKSVIKEPKNKNSKFKIQYLDVIEKYGDQHE